MAFKKTIYNPHNGISKEMMVLNDLNHDYIRKIQQKFHLNFSDSKVLDIGIGGGYLAEGLIKSGRLTKYTGIDLDNYLQKNIKKKIGLIKADLNHFQDIEKIMNSKIKYDLIFCFDVLEHLIHFNFLLNNIHKLMERKGFFIISLPIDINLSTRIKLFLKDNPFADPFNSVYGHINLLSIKRAEDGFKNIKRLKIVDTKKCGLGYGLYDRKFHLDKVANLFPFLTSRIYICLQKS